MVYISSLPLAAVLRSDEVLEKISNICMKLAKKAFFTDENMGLCLCMILVHFLMHSPYTQSKVLTI